MRLVFLALLAYQAAPPAGKIAGIVLVGAANSSPIGDVNVQLQDVRDGSLVREAMSGADGAFVFEGVEPGHYRVNASKPGYSFGGNLGSGGTILALEAHGEYHCKLFMSETASVSGSVSDADAAPLKNIRLVLLDARAPGAVMNSQEALTDSRGHFSFGEVQPGFYALLAFNGFEAGTAPMTPLYFPTPTEAGRLRFFPLKTGQRSSNIRLVAPPFERRTISGTVTNVPEAWKSAGQSFAVALVPQQGLRIPIATATTDARGRFSIPAAPTGSFDLIAWGPVTGRGMVGPMVADQHLEGTVSLGSEVGDVREKEVPLNGNASFGVRLVASGARDADACLAHTALRLIPRDAPLFRREMHAAVNQNHEAVFQSVPLGRYELAIEDKTCALSEAAGSVVVTGNGRVEAAVSALIGAMGGIVSDANQKPISEGAWVLAIRQGAGEGEMINPQDMLTTLADSQGRFHFANLRPGKYQLMAKQQVDWSECLTPSAWKDAMVYD